MSNFLRFSFILILISFFFFLLKFICYTPYVFQLVLCFPFRSFHQNNFVGVKIKTKESVHAYMGFEGMGAKLKLENCAQNNIKTSPSHRFKIQFIFRTNSVRNANILNSSLLILF